MILGKPYLGATEASKVYLGATQVYPTASVGVEFYEWSDFGTPSTALVGVEAATIKEDYLSGGWRDRGLDTTEICGVGQTDTTQAPTSDYCLKMTSTVDNAYRHLYSPNTLVIGKTYRWSFWALNNGTSNTAVYKTNSGFTDDSGYVPIANNNNWIYYEFESIATATTMDVYFYSNRFGTIGGYIYVDNCSILQID